MAGTIARFVSNYDDARSIGSNLRRRRAEPLLRIIDRCFRSKGSVRLLDVGGMEKYWNICEPDWLASRRVKITLSNLPDDLPAIMRGDIFEEHEGDGCALPYSDDSFDICHSNSTIEHVGNWSRKVSFARETRRVAPAFFVQTPNFWFPWEPHFGFAAFHWMPDPVKLAIVSRFSLGWSKQATTIDDGMYQVEYASLLTRRMMENLYPDAELIVERFIGLPKSFVAVRAPR